METIAVYWEPTIKTYGFKEIYDVSFIRLGSNDLEKVGSLIDELDPVKNEFSILWNHNDDMNLCFGVPGKNRALVIEKLKKRCSGQDVVFKQEIYPAGLVYFNGPHYGDRYGIAKTVFETLDNKVEIIAAAFSGAAVYLVFSPDDVKSAVSLLSRAFEIPDGAHD